MPGHDEERQWSSQLITQTNFWRENAVALDEAAREALKVMPEGDVADALRSALLPRTDDDGTGWVSYTDEPPVG